MDDFFNNFFSGIFKSIGVDTQTAPPQPDPSIGVVLGAGPDRGNQWLFRDYPYKEPHPMDDWVQQSFQQIANERRLAVETQREARVRSAPRDVTGQPDTSSVMAPDDTHLSAPVDPEPVPQEVKSTAVVPPDDTFLTPPKTEAQRSPKFKPTMRLAGPTDNATPVSIQDAVRRSFMPKLNFRGTWTSTDPRWAALSDVEKAAAMSLMEADSMDIKAAINAAAAMVNRSAKDNQPLGKHVSARIYQPTFEPAQQKRLGAILKSKQFQEMKSWIERYQKGAENDPTNGATHFLAHPKVMLALEAGNPRKYRSWRSWTGFNQSTGTYRNQTISDDSHAFLAPEGRFSYAEALRKSASGK